MAAKLPFESNKPDLDAIKKSLGELEAPKVKKARERATQFAALYETIRNLINSGVSKRAILDSLAAHSLVLTYGQLDELLSAEAERRGESVPAKGAILEASDADQIQISDNNLEEAV